MGFGLGLLDRGFRLGGGHGLGHGLGLGHGGRDDRLNNRLGGRLSSGLDDRFGDGLGGGGLGFDGGFQLPRLVLLDNLGEPCQLSVVGECVRITLENELEISLGVTRRRHDDQWACPRVLENELVKTIGYNR